VLDRLNYTDRTLGLDACCRSINPRSGDVKQQVAQLGTLGFNYYVTFSSGL
jgi:hypothetical protein